MRYYVNYLPRKFSDEFVNGWNAYEIENKSGSTSQEKWYITKVIIGKPSAQGKEIYVKDKDVFVDEHGAIRKVFEL